MGYSVLLTGAGAENTQAMRYPWVQYIQRFLLLFGTMNLSVGLFNLLPMPPLDGFHILNDVILKGRLSLNRSAFQLTHTIVIVLMLSGALSGILNTAFDAVEDAVLNVLLMIAGLH